MRRRHIAVSDLLIQQGLDEYWKIREEEVLSHRDALLGAINTFDAKHLVRWLCSASEADVDTFLDASLIPGIEINYVSEALFDGFAAVLQKYIEQRQ